MAVIEPDESNRAAYLEAYAEWKKELEVKKTEDEMKENKDGMQEEEKEKENCKGKSTK